MAHAASPSAARPAAWVCGLTGRAAAGLVVAALFMASTLPTPLYPLYSGAFDLSPLTSALLFAVYTVGNLTALLLFGRLSDQIGRKPMALVGLALAAAAMALFIPAKAPAWLFAARLASGLAVGAGAGAATSWITELTPKPEQPRSASFMTAFNFAGLALGPLLGGALVQYAPAAFRTPYWVFLALAALVAAPVALTAETVGRKAGRLDLKPRIGVPGEARAAFIAPAATGFAAMALVGFYAALGPTTLSEDLHVKNVAAGGAIVAELFVVGAAAIVATRALAPRVGMLVGLAATPVGLALLVAAQRLGSLTLMLAGTAVCGVAAALGYRGALQVVGGLAPPDRRSEVVSALFLACFFGNAVPVVGIGALTQARGGRLADLTFAVVVSAIALAAFATGLAVKPKPPA